MHGIRLYRIEELSPLARRTVFAGCIGFAVDFLDIYLQTLARTPVIGYFELLGLSAAASTTIYFFTFAAMLFGRPCGAVIFGHWAGDQPSADDEDQHCRVWPVHGADHPAAGLCHDWHLVAGPAALHRLRLRGR